MQTSTPASPQAQLDPGLPESAGPMTEDGAGGAYPATQLPRVVISNTRDPEERAQELASYDGQCRHCKGIPIQALAAMQAALATAQAEAETATVKAGARL
jgi:hypothetical protein